MCCIQLVVERLLISLMCAWYPAGSARQSCPNNVRSQVGLKRGETPAAHMPRAWASDSIEHGAGASSLGAPSGAEARYAAFTVTGQGASALPLPTSATSK